MPFAGTRSTYSAATRHVLSPRLFDETRKSNARILVDAALASLSFVCHAPKRVASRSNCKEDDALEAGKNQAAKCVLSFLRSRHPASGHVFTGITTEVLNAAEDRSSTESW
jgi:hypothetical protein